jgi:hypothetical protein
VPAVLDKDQPDGRSTSPAAPTWADVLARHRRDWVVAAAGGREVVDLDSERDPAASIAKASTDTAVLWIESFSSHPDGALRTELSSAVARGVPVVAGFGGGDKQWREAQRLRDQLGGAVLVVQQLAAGSLIGAHARPSDAAHVLVCANLEALSANGAAAELDASAVPLLSGYVGYLEQSNRALREANVRLAREQLGVHDAAAAAVEARRTELEEQVADQKRQAKANYDLWVEAKNALEAPRYRMVDAVRDIAFSLPGLGFLLRRRSQRIQARG